MKNIFAKIAATVATGAAVMSAIAVESPKANAASLTIVNAGFEAVPLQDDEFAEFNVPGWELYDPAGLLDRNPSSYATFNPAPVYYPNGVPEGNNGAGIYITKPPGSGQVGIFQTLQAVLTADTAYTLQVNIGNIAPSPDFPDLVGFPGYAVQLLAGGNVIAQDFDTLKPADGTWTTSTVTYTAAANDPYLGQQLEIRLLNVLLREGQDANFDNVRLDATKVPEPTSILALLGLGAIGATSAFKKKKKQPQSNSIL